MFLQDLAVYQNMITITHDSNLMLHSCRLVGVQIQGLCHSVHV